jgi:DNA-binding transcriptional regulator LsrR (DeoR family)
MISPSISTSSLAPLLAHKTNALCYQMNGPILSSNEAIAQSLLSDNTIVRTLNVSRKCDVAIFGMAPLGKDSLLFRSGLISEQDIVELKNRGVVGTILGRFFDHTGNEVESSFKSRAVSITWENFMNIPERIAMIGGMEKAFGLRCLMKKGVMTTVIMDSLTAEALLEEQEKQE